MSSRLFIILLVVAVTVGLVQAVLQPAAVLPARTVVPSSSSAGSAPTVSRFDEDSLEIEGRRYHGGDFYCAIQAASGDPTLVFEWRYAADYQLLGDVAVKREKFPVRFWPTAATWVNDTNLLVGGMTRLEGETVLEQWVFDAPTLKAPSYAVHYDSALGENVESWRLPVLREVNALHASAASSMNGVRALVVNKGAANTAFVLFDDSSDIYSLDLRTGLLALVASSNSGAAFINAHLNSDLAGGYGVRHETDGYVYIFGPPGMEDVPFVFLIDSDEDGAIDLINDSTDSAGTWGYLKGDGVIEVF